MNPSMAWSPTFVTVKSTVPGFRPIECWKVNLRTDTWQNVLDSNGMTVDMKEYCLKSCDLKTIIRADEKVASYISRYKKKMNVYTVKLSKLTSGDREKIGNNVLRATQLNGFSSYQSGRHAETPQSTPQGPYGSVNNTRDRDPFYRLEQNHNSHDSQHQRRFSEDLLDMTFEDNEVVRDRPTGTGTEYFDDNASQFSEESQVDLDDLKGVALKRLEQAPNSSCFKVREEIQNLKRRHNYMRISSYIPNTINLLTHLFGNNF
ncbi:unnamed protein product [Allacma fusca]|uniref:Uncharacterized protein n=1 Tax=Allacma fusca TaxID=39272 RepID=A0A8J2LBV6_9HEXA|nr:unnamed protein product [Allacma fusca]